MMLETTIKNTVSLSSGSNRVITIAGILIFAIVFSIGDYVIPMGLFAHHVWADVAWTLTALIAAIRCLATARHVQGDEKTAWQLFGLGCAAWFIGMLLWSYFELIEDSPIPFPGISDIGFLAFAPFLMAGLILYLRNSSSFALTVKVLGELALVLCVTIITMIVILYNPLVEMQESSLYLITALAYPALYVGVFLFGLFRGVASNLYRYPVPYLLLMAALFIHAATNVVYAASLLGKNYDIGDYLDVFWIVGFGFIYWAAVEASIQSSGKKFVDIIIFDRARYLEAAISGVAIAWLIILYVIYSDVVTSGMTAYILPFVLMVALCITVIGWADHDIQKQLYKDLLVSEKHLKILNNDLENRVAERTTELELSRNQALKASQAKSEFLSHMSHELRTPLNAVLGFSQLLDLDETLSKNQRESVVYITEAGNYLLSLVNDTLELQSIEANKLVLNLENIDLIATLNECLKLVGHLADKNNVEITNNIKTNDVYVRADPVRLKQILVNLISNAIKYNSDNGSVTISVVESDDEHIRILISDTGVGIPVEEQHKVFDAFVRLSPGAGEGNGVGLAVAKHLINAMKGNIGLESTPGSGSTFWIELCR
jgi:signal transduction histidine kinase